MEEVRAFQHRVATELAAARRELTLVRAENVQLKRALRAWSGRPIPTNARYGPDPRH